MAPLNKFKLTTQIYWKNQPDAHCLVCDYEFIDQQFIVAVTHSFLRALTCSPTCADTYVLQHMDDLDMGSFDKFIFPMIKATFPSLIASDIVKDE